MDNEWFNRYQEIQKIVEEHHKYRRTCLNMVAAETVTSQLVECILGSDLSRRYSSPGVYAGDKHFRKVYELTLGLLSKLFGAEYINIKPVTGNLAVMAILTGLAEPGDKIIKVGDQHGGYPIRLAEWANVEIIPFAFDFERMNINTIKAKEQIIQNRPNLVVMGASKFLYPHPVRELAEVAHEVGATVVYDGSHVMGLIAGGEFQDPLKEGADVLYGSVHKTFPGPQRGMIATNNKALMEQISHVLAPPPFLLSCHHLNSAAALGVAAAEMLAFGHQYANQVVRNSRVLAKALLDNDIKVFSAEDSGCTQSHQVILENGGAMSEQGHLIKRRMENCGIIADSIVRIGTQEVTRLGMGEDEMRKIGSLIADVILSRRSVSAIHEDVRALAEAYQSLHFAFDTASDCYDFICDR